MGCSCSSNEQCKKNKYKAKNLRRNLKNWVKNLPCLKKLIKRVNETIELLDIFEELRPLSTEKEISEIC
jgi:hypothetical protein